MKISKKQVDKIEEALISAYRRREDVQFPSEWRQELMREIRVQARPVPASMAPRRILAWAAAAMAVILGWLVLTNIDRHDPWININPVIIFMDSRADVWLEAGDTDSGLRHLKVTLIQEGQEIEVLSHEVKQPGRFLGIIGSTKKKVEITVVLDAETLQLKTGPAKILIAARDLAWRNNFQGRLTTLEKDIFVDLNPSF